MIKFLEGVKSLLYKVYKLAKEKNDIENFGGIFFNDFEEVKRDFIKVKGNHVFLNENLLLDNNSNCLKRLFSNFSLSDRTCQL